MSRATRAEREPRPYLVGILGVVAGLLFTAVGHVRLLALDAATADAPSDDATGERFLLGLVVPPVLAAAVPSLVAGWIAPARYGRDPTRAGELAVVTLGWALGGAALGAIAVWYVLSSALDPLGEVAPYILVGVLIVVLPVVSIATAGGIAARHAVRAMRGPPSTLAAPVIPGLRVPDGGARPFTPGPKAPGGRSGALIRMLPFLAGALAVVALGPVVLGAVLSVAPEAALIVSALTAGILVIAGYQRVLADRDR